VKPIDKLLADFRCPKCRNGEAVAKEGALAERIPLVGSGRYVFISCTLCGYTEVYNLKILVRAEEKQAAEEAAKKTARELA